MKSTQQKIDETEKKLTQLKEQLKEESNRMDWIKIPNTNYEITKNVIYKGKSYDEIMKLKKSDEELLDLEIIGKICKHPELIKELKMDSSSTKDDFFFKQPFPQNEKKGYVARFYAYSVYAYLGCGEYSSDSYSGLGVRFVRRTKGGKK